MVDDDLDPIVAPRRFVLERAEDVTGVSGPGVVAWGVEWPDGRVATHWHSELTNQTSVWDSLAAVQVVHGHEGRTRVRWLDPQWRLVHEGELT